MRESAKKRSWNGGQVLGYDIVNKALVINEKEIKVVEEIFLLRAQKHSYKTIANVLNERGEVTKNGKSFSANTINYIVKNPVYIGRDTWGRYRGGGRVKL